MNAATRFRFARALPRRSSAGGAVLSGLAMILTGCATGGTGRSLAAIHPTMAVEVGRAHHAARVLDQPLTARGGIVGLTLGAEPAEWMELRARLTAGSLGGTGIGVDRDMRRIESEALVPLWSWLHISIGGEHRLYEGELASQEWTAMSTGAEIRLPMLRGAGRGIVRGSLFPLMDIEGLPRPTLAVAGATGIELRRRWLVGALMYRIERLDFPFQAGDRRREQLASIALQLGIRWPRPEPTPPTP